jgi:hypothetical protein
VTTFARTIGVRRHQDAGGDVLRVSELMHRRKNKVAKGEIAIIAEKVGGEESQEKRARRLFDAMARDIGREAVNHLKTMYPAALQAVPKNAELSLTNRIRNDINWRMRPLLMAMIAMHKEWDEEQTSMDAGNR